MRARLKGTSRSQSYSFPTPFTLIEAETIDAKAFLLFFFLCFFTSPLIGLDQEMYCARGDIRMRVIGSSAQSCLVSYDHPFLFVLLSRSVERRSSGSTRCSKCCVSRAFSLGTVCVYMCVCAATLSTLFGVLDPNRGHSPILRAYCVDNTVWKKENREKEKEREREGHETQGAATSEKRISYLSIFHCPRGTKSFRWSRIWRGETEEGRHGGRHGRPKKRPLSRNENTLREQKKTFTEVVFLIFFI